ncbi:MAG: class I SAM-dependent methyltransferase [Chloroflexota bacterium]
MEDTTINNSQKLTTQQVQTQFGQSAHKYVTSTVHAQGSDLLRMVELAQLPGMECVLDVATGGGHTARAFAHQVSQVVAYDITFEMLDAARSFVYQQQVTDMHFCSGDAAYLPFQDNSFDCVTTRIAAHHFANPEPFVKEVARVLRPQGILLINDNMVPDDQELDMCMNRFEQWRDPSHIRAYTTKEWQQWIEGAELQVTQIEPLAYKHHDFMEWTARMHMPEGERCQLEDWLVQLPQHCKTFFNIEIERNRILSLSNTYSIIVAQSMK